MKTGRVGFHHQSEKKLLYCCGSDPMFAIMFHFCDSVSKKSVFSFAQGSESLVFLKLLLRKCI